tara:strand:- start:8299 stop:8856 length:558 start_codon:yes stop_codon:yes gene_type:complete
MHPREIDTFKTQLKNSKCYLEYGIGASTVIAHESTQIPIYSIESSREWINKINKSINDKNRYKCKFIDVGPVGKFGTPSTLKKKGSWCNYPNAIFDIDFSIDPDLVLVDGRFRVACVLSVVKYATQNNLKINIMLHDCQRKHYSPINKYINRINQQDTLLLFEPKKNINLTELDDDFKKYQYEVK